MKATLEIVKENEPENETTGSDFPVLAETPGTLPEVNEHCETLPAEKRFSSGTPEETRLMGFIAPLPSSDEARSAPQNLIDSTLEHLHGLMKCVGAETPRGRANPDSINAVCNLAKNMRDLMNLKLQIIKTAKETGENSH